MKIELDDALMIKIGVGEEEARELLAIALYKYKRIHGSLAGRLIGKSEFAFHNLVAEREVSVNYSLDDLVDDIKIGDL